MADSLSPRIPSAPGRLYGSELRRQWRATEQLQRQRVRIPAAVERVAASGGIAGQAETLTTGGIAARAGAGSMDNTAITWDTPYDPATGAPVSWATTTATGIIVPVGWYSIAMLIKLGWTLEADAPTAFAPVINGANALPAIDGHVRPRSRISATAWGVYDYIHTGPVYVDDEIAPYCSFLSETPATDAVVAGVGLTITQYA